MGYAGVGVGPFDLAAGFDFLLKSKGSGFPWLSANLLDSNENPIFQSSLIHNVGQTRIGLIGLTGQVTNLDDQFTLAPYPEILKKEVEKLEKKCDLIVLLSSLSPKENDEITRNFQSVNIIISSSGSSSIRPKLVHQTLTGQIQSKGKYQGVITINPGTIPKWKTNDQLPATLENRLASYDWQLKRMKKRKELHDEGYLEKIRQIEKRRDELQNKIIQLEKEIAVERESHQIPATFTAETLALQMNITPDPAIERALVQLKYKIKQHNKKIKQSKNILRNIFMGKNSNKDGQSLLAGFDACGACHEKQSKFWKETEHSNAYQTLVKEDQNFNLDCISCHVTTSTNPKLLGEKEKEALLKLPASLQMVGCESCHGTGLSHIVNPKTARTVKVTEQTCLGCHTEEHSDKFDYNTWVGLIRCPAG